MLVRFRSFRLSIHPSTPGDVDGDVGIPNCKEDTLNKVALERRQPPSIDCPKKNHPLTTLTLVMLKISKSF